MAVDFLRDPAGGGVATAVEANRLSILDGGPPPELPFRHIGAALEWAAATWHGPRLVFEDSSGVRAMSYADLLARATATLGGLQATAGNARPGEVVVLRVDDGADLLASVWACALGGFVALPVAGRRNGESDEDATTRLRAVCAHIETPWLVAESDTDLRDVPARMLGNVEELAALAAPAVLHSPMTDDLTLLLLTSGSTGRPKAVTLTHRNILTRIAATIERNGLRPSDSTYNWMPLDHIGGLVMFHMRDVVVGSTQVHAPIDWILQDPTRWLQGMHQHGSSTTWAPNFAFRLVVDRAESVSHEEWDLHALRYIMNGGEPIKPHVARQFLAILGVYGVPERAMHPGWGMSETSSGVVDCVFDPRAVADDERFVSVGAPQPGVTVRVVDRDDAAVPEGVVGRLQVRGDSITKGYFRNEETNAAAFTTDGWFRTGDLAFIADGALTVTGRVDDVVDVGAVAYHGHEIESAVEELPGVEPSYTVGTAVTLPGSDGETLAVFLCARTGVAEEELAGEVREAVRQRFGTDDVVVAVLARAAVPKTGIGKLRRTLLRDEFESAFAEGTVTSRMQVVAMRLP
jgi:acyl-CoA synthetase (AMP-forming)/AMP-acid ligase II